MTIAVDFDGTIVEHQYPAIGKERPFATATLRKLIEDGHKLILWSVREGELLDEAIQWCAERGVTFHAANQNFDEDQQGETTETNKAFSRKLKVSLFIDDRNLGGLPDWGVIYQLISRRISYEQYLREQILGTSQTKKKHWWQR